MEGVLLIGGIDPRGRDLVLMSRVARSILRTNAAADHFARSNGWTGPDVPEPINMKQRLSSRMDPRLFPDKEF